MRTKAENVLEDNFENYAVEVYVYGLASAYDSKILSADLATIENFTNALPDDNLSIVWIAFDENEIGDKYDETIKYIEEIVKDFDLSNSVIECYFVSQNIVKQCKDKITTNHADYSYQTISDMDIVLSSQRPIYKYYYEGNGFGLMLKEVVN